MNKNYSFYYNLVILLFSISSFGQPFNPDIYNKPYPELITVAGQPDNFRFTTHMVNIKIPTAIANNWSVEVEKQYIQSLFNLIEDKDFLIINYSGFYFPPSSGLSGAHHVNIQNTVENIGLPTFSYASQYNSNNLLGITRLVDGWGMNPKIVTHELFHQWNSFLDSANYWLMDPSNHTGLVEENTSVFDNYTNTFEHVVDTIYSYRQYYSGGFSGNLEGYLAGLWDMPENLRTLKNYYHYPSLPSTYMGDYYLVQVKADEIVDLNKNQLFTLYGGERIPNYQNSENNYNCAVIVFSLENFLNDNYTKAFHYASIVNEFKDPNSTYNEKYDEVFTLTVHPSQNNPEYGVRLLNPYHASYKNLQFKTRLFDGTMDITESGLASPIVLYPNPTRNSFSINSETNIESVTIYNVFGKLIRTYPNQNKYEILGLSKGLYLVSIKRETGSTVQKLIIE